MQLLAFDAQTGAHYCMLAPEPTKELLCIWRDMRKAASFLFRSHLAMSYVQVANRAIEPHTGGQHRVWAQRLSRGAPRHPLLSALIPLVTQHAKSDDSEELWPTSKIGKYMCMSVLFVH